MRIIKNLITACKEISIKLSKDNVSGYAAQSCFYVILSFIPFIMLLLTLIKYSPISSDTILTIIKELAPVQLHPYMDSIVNELFERSAFTLISLSALTTVWAAGRGFLSLMLGFNSVYDIEVSRNSIIQRLLATLYTLIFLFVMIQCLIILVFGNQLLNLVKQKFPRVGTIISCIIQQKYLIFPALLMLLFLCLYKFIPNRKTSIVHELPGACLASAGWFLYSYFYSVYVDNSPGFSKMYGSLTTLVFALIWLYSCMVIIFYGAEFNVLLKKHYFKRLFEHYRKN